MEGYRSPMRTGNYSEKESPQKLKRGGLGGSSRRLMNLRDLKAKLSLSDGDSAYVPLSDDKLGENPP